MKYSPKVQILKQLHEIWLIDNDDMRVIELQINSILESNGLPFFSPTEIEGRYFIPNISEVGDAMYLHMNTSLSDDYYYFAGIVESFVDFSPLITKERNQDCGRFFHPLTSPFNNASNIRA